MLPDRSFSELFDIDDSPDRVTETRMKTANRRTQARIPHEVDVAVAADGQLIAGASRDISEGGMFVATHRVVPDGARVTLEIALPNGQILARGIVKWRREGGAAEAGQSPGIGIVFEDLAQLDRDRLASFCRGRPRFYTYDEVVAASAL